jgi:hypothetical protein
LNESWFITMEQAREIVEEWRVDYSTARAHNSLEYMMPDGQQQLRVSPPTIITRYRGRGPCIAQASALSLQFHRGATLSRLFNFHDHFCRHPSEERVAAEPF